MPEAVFIFRYRAPGWSHLSEGIINGFNESVVSTRAKNLKTQESSPATSEINDEPVSLHSRRDARQKPSEIKRTAHASDIGSSPTYQGPQPLQQKFRSRSLSRSITPISHEGISILPDSQPRRISRENHIDSESVYVSQVNLNGRGTNHTPKEIDQLTQGYQELVEAERLQATQNLRDKLKAFATRASPYSANKLTSSRKPSCAVDIGQQQSPIDAIEPLAKFTAAALLTAKTTNQTVGSKFNIGDNSATCDDHAACYDPGEGPADPSSRDTRYGHSQTENPDFEDCFSFSSTPRPSSMSSAINRKNIIGKPHQKVSHTSSYPGKVPQAPASSSEFSFADAVPLKRLRRLPKKTHFPHKRLPTFSMVLSGTHSTPTADQPRATCHNSVIELPRKPQQPSKTPKAQSSSRSRSHLSISSAQPVTPEDTLAEASRKLVESEIYCGPTPALKPTLVNGESYSVELDLAIAKNSGTSELSETVSE